MFTLRQNRYGPVHLALGRPKDSKEYWFVVSDEPTELKTFEEYGLRFDIEENFLDDKSNGFQLESSLIRSAKALERLCCMLAITTLYLVAQGTEVVTQGKRRWVDSHWFRGQSYLKIGWGWVKLALSRGYELMTSVHLPAEADPAPPWPQKFSIRNNLSCSSLWSSKMLSRDRLEFCQSISSKGRISVGVEGIIVTVSALTVVQPDRSHGGLGEAKSALTISSPHLAAVNWKQPCVFEPRTITASAVAVRADVDRLSAILCTQCSRRSGRRQACP